MWMPSNFGVQYDTFYDGQIQQDASKYLLMLIEVINKARHLIVVLVMIVPHGFLYLISYFHLC